MGSTPSSTAYSAQASSGSGSPRVGGFGGGCCGCRPQRKRAMNSPDPVKRQVSDASAFYSVYEGQQGPTEGGTVQSFRTPQIATRNVEAMSVRSGVAEPPPGLREAYAFRPRIPSFVDVKSHAEGNWWSDAHHDCAIITKDMGGTVKVISRVLNVKTAELKVYKPENIFDFFEEYQPYMKGKAYVVYRMILGDLQCVSLCEVTDKELFRKIFSCPKKELVNKRLKLITCPVNLPVNLPLKGPRSADGLGDYFGEEATQVDVHWATDAEDVDYACISVDIYSKWIIRKILPNVAFNIGRICDFIIVDYEARAVVCGLRVICTSVALDKFKPKNTNNSKHQ